jgi:hypothetical protein
LNRIYQKSSPMPTIVGRVSRDVSSRYVFGQTINLIITSIRL